MKKRSFYSKNPPKMALSSSQIAQQQVRRPSSAKGDCFRNKQAVDRSDNKTTWLLDKRPPSRQSSAFPIGGLSLLIELVDDDNENIDCKSTSSSPTVVTDTDDSEMSNQLYTIIDEDEIPEPYVKHVPNPRRGSHRRDRETKDHLVVC